MDDTTQKTCQRLASGVSFDFSSFAVRFFGRLRHLFVSAELAFLLLQYFVCFSAWSVVCVTAGSVVLAFRGRLAILCFLPVPA